MGWVGGVGSVGWVGWVYSPVQPSGRALELLAKPVHRQISGCHGVKQEILQVLQGLGIGENRFCFVHAPTIAHPG